MRQIAAIFLLVISFAISPALAEETKYTCPMHPHYIAEEAGSCPICGMDLVELSQEEDTIYSDTDTGSGEKKILYWQAPMDPNYKMDKPGKSPMGMDLVPVYGTDNDGKGDGRSAIRISPETIQNIGVRTQKAEAARFGTDVRSYGVVTENVREQDDLSSRVGGWVEELKVTAVGDEVKKGDLLFTLYSPDLVSAQQDYIAAIASGAKGRISSSAKRLKSLGVQDKALEEIKKKRRKLQNVPFYAITDGVISKLNVKRGTFVKSGMQIAEIQSYATVWINVSVAEKDLGFLSKNMKAEVTFPNLSSDVRTARIDYIYPTIDKASRTGQVRLVLDNPDGILRPGAYADVSFDTVSVKRLAIPSEAVLRSSEGNYVVVAIGDGRFQSRKVKTGIYNRGRVQVLSGLNEGDDVVVSSQFMIDSESSLRESFRKMQKIQTSLSQLDVDKNQMAMINHLIDSAIYIHESLTDGYAINPKMLMPSLKLNDHLMPKFRGTKLQFILEGAEKAIMEAKDSITDSEEQVALANLIRSLKPWLFEGKPQYYKDKGLKLYMDHGTGNLWLQLGSEPTNPYGNDMSMLQEWPDKVETTTAPDADAATAPAGGAHAGH